MRGQWWGGAMVIGLAVGGCARDGERITASVVIGEPVTMAPGDTLSIEGTVRLRFHDVINDSRCAVDVVCITAGDATARFGLGFSNPAIMAPIVPLELRVGPAGVAAASAYGYRVTVTALTPEPRAGVTINPGDYRVVVELRTDPGSAVPAPRP